MNKIVLFIVSALSLTRLEAMELAPADQLKSIAPYNPAQAWMNRAPGAVAFAPYAQKNLLTGKLPSLPVAVASAKTPSALRFKVQEQLKALKDMVNSEVVSLERIHALLMAPNEKGLPALVAHSIADLNTLFKDKAWQSTMRLCAQEREGMLLNEFAKACLEANDRTAEDHLDESKRELIGNAYHALSLASVHAVGLQKTVATTLAQRLKSNYIFLQTVAQIPVPEPICAAQQADEESIRSACSLVKKAALKEHIAPELVATALAIVEDQARGKNNRSAGLLAYYYFETERRAKEPNIKLLEQAYVLNKKAHKQDCSYINPGQLEYFLSNLYANQIRLLGSYTMQGQSSELERNKITNSLCLRAAQLREESITNGHPEARFVFQSHRFENVFFRMNGRSEAEVEYAFKQILDCANHGSRGAALLLEQWCSNGVDGIVLLPPALFKQAAQFVQTYCRESAFVKALEENKTLTPASKLFDPTASVLIKHAMLACARNNDDQARSYLVKAIKEHDNRAARLFLIDLDLQRATPASYQHAFENIDYLLENVGDLNNPRYHRIFIRTFFALAHLLEKKDYVPGHIFSAKRCISHPNIQLTPATRIAVIRKLGETQMALIKQQSPLLTDLETMVTDLIKVVNEADDHNASMGLLNMNALMLDYRGQHKQDFSSALSSIRTFEQSIIKQFFYGAGVDSRIVQTDAVYLARLIGTLGSIVGSSWFKAARSKDSRLSCVERLAVMLELAAMTNQKTPLDDARTRLAYSMIKSYADRTGALVDPDAQWLYSRLCKGEIKIGSVVLSQPEKSGIYAARARSNGHPEAAYEIGMFYMRPENKNWDKAIDCLSVAARAEYDQAYYPLGQCQYWRALLNVRAGTVAKVALGYNELSSAFNTLAQAVKVSPYPSNQFARPFLAATAYLIEQFEKQAWCLLAPLFDQAETKLKIADPIEKIFELLELPKKLNDNKQYGLLVCYYDLIAHARPTASIEQKNAVAKLTAVLETLRKNGDIFALKELAQAYRDGTYLIKNESQAAALERTIQDLQNANPLAKPLAQARTGADHTFAQDIAQPTAIPHATGSCVNFYALNLPGLGVLNFDEQGTMTTFQEVIPGKTPLDQNTALSTLTTPIEQPICQGIQKAPSTNKMIQDAQSASPQTKQRVPESKIVVKPVMPAQDVNAPKPIPRTSGYSVKKSEALTLLSQDDLLFDEEDINSSHEDPFNGIGRITFDEQGATDFQEVNPEPVTLDQSAYLSKLATAVTKMGSLRPRVSQSNSPSTNK